MGRIFGTDGARGVAITELTVELATNIGRAAAFVLAGKKMHKPKIIVGKDTRISSDILENALSAGLASVGADVEILGVVPTPAVAYLVKKYNADAGVMISASHNTVEYNGIKLFSSEGFKLSDEIENEIESYILDNPEKIKLSSGIDVGRITYNDNAVKDYNNHLISTVKNEFHSLKIAVDCANGSASYTAKAIFDALGANTVFIGNSPDGTNINEACGSTHIENLSKLVVDEKCDIGVAFDGDADRCLAIDENGSLVDGDKLIAIISKHMKDKGTLKKDTAVVTVMSNLGFHSYMKENNIKTVCTAVGDRYVLEEMLKNGYNIGGEQSGHIIFLDNASTGDGQLTALTLIDMLVEKNAKLSALVADIKDYPQILLGVKLRDGVKGHWKTNEKITSSIADAENTLGEEGRVLVRESGTEPLLRIMLEGKEHSLIEKLANNIADISKKEIGV